MALVGSLLSGCALLPPLLPPTAVQEPPVQPADPDSADSADSVAGWPVGEHGVLVRLAISEGYDHSAMVTFAADGRVVRVGDTSVLASVEDFTTWRIDRAGLRKVLRAFDGLAVRGARSGDFGDPRVGPDVRSVGLFWGDGRVISGSVPRYDGRGDSPGQPLWDLATAVAEPGWVGRHVVEVPRPWVPDAVGVVARPPGSAGSPTSGGSPAPWPLARTVEELAAGGARGPEGERSFCLRGQEAARVFRLMRPGTNSAWLGVDDGRRWELNLQVVTPAYVTSGNPCGGLP